MSTHIRRHLKLGPCSYTSVGHIVLVMAGSHEIYRRVNEAAVTDLGPLHYARIGRTWRLAWRQRTLIYRNSLGFRLGSNH